MALAFLLAVTASSALAASVVFQQPPPLGGGWQATGKRVAPQTQLHLTIALQRPRVAEAGDIALDRANPESVNFRQWLSFEETQALVRPAPAAVSAVQQWLRAQNIPFTQSADGQQFFLTPLVFEAERLFGTEFEVVANRATRQTWHRAGRLVLPADVAAHVSAVFGAHGLPAAPKQPTSPAAIVDVGPKEIRETYQVSGRGSGSLKARQAVAEFQGQFMDSRDLHLFFQNLVPSAQSGDDQVYKVVGTPGKGEGVEALLDIEYIMGLAPGVKTEFWAWKNFDFCQDLKNWTSHIISTSDKPMVFSVSYGRQGDLSQIGCQDAEVKEIDKDLATIATTGVTIIFASGDSGSGYSNDKLYPSWPASSPWVTAVGSTCFTDSTKATEEASTQFGSGSGFSSMFPQASWQKAAAEHYLSTASGLPPSRLFNKTGRGTADVSALGEGYKVYVGGNVEIVGGTSAAAPAFAALISLVNDAQVGKGSKTLGFLNPWLYQHASAFTDITKGSDKVSRSGFPLSEGYECAAGWDPATGLGTPIFPKLKAAA